MLRVSSEIGCKKSAALSLPNGITIFGESSGPWCPNSTRFSSEGENFSSDPLSFPDDIVFEFNKFSAEGIRYDDCKVLAPYVARATKRSRALTVAQTVRIPFRFLPLGNLQAFSWLCRKSEQEYCMSCYWQGGLALTELLKMFSVPWPCAHTDCKRSVLQNRR